MARIRRMGEAYSSGDVVVTINGIYDVDPTAIEYNQKYTHSYQRGLHRSPRAWRMGAKEYEGNITLPIDIISEFEKIAPNGDIALIRPFPIIVEFFNVENEKIKDIIIAKFQGDGRSVTNDGELEYQYDLFIIEISLNV